MFSNLEIPQFFLFESVDFSTRENLTPISENQFHDFLNYNCKEYFKICEEFSLNGNQFKLYRGFPYFKGDDIPDNYYYERTSFTPESFIGDTTTRNTLRKSIESSNFYNFLMDFYLPSFSNFPKRTKSLICSNLLDIAESFGTPLYVIPFDNVNVAITTYGDIWGTFHNLKFPGGKEKSSLEYFDFYWEKIFSMIYGRSIKFKDIINQPSDLLKILNDVDSTLKYRIISRGDTSSNLCIEYEMMYKEKLDELLTFIHDSYKSNANHRGNILIDIVFSELFKSPYLYNLKWNKKSFLNVPNIFEGMWELWFEGKYLVINMKI